MNRDWEKYGRDIRSLVDNAIRTQNFQQLNKNITDSLNGAVNDIQKGIQAAGQAVTDAVNWRGQSREDERVWDGQKQPYKNVEAWKGAKHFQKDMGAWNSKEKSRLRPVAQKNELVRPDLFQKNTSVSAGGWVLAACGYTFGSVTGLAAMVLIIIAFFLDFVPVGLKIAIGILIPLFACSGFMAWKGSSMLSALKRYRGYVASLQGRTYCNIKELSDQNGRSPKYILKDVQKMIEKGWFRQGHLDQDRKCLIVSHDTYQEYRAIQQRRKEQEESGLLRQEAERENPEQGSVGQVIEEGNSYLRKIRECKDAILEAEISRKISRIEMQVQRIFERVRENPDSLEDIRKLMEYYLPTTVKLLEAYRQLECQPIQGANIKSSKREIEETLDTLNVAFEKLLDSLFEDVAWDVSTDISVLHTMLAQEGLTEGDFNNTKRLEKEHE